MKNEITIGIVTGVSVALIVGISTWFLTNSLKELTDRQLTKVANKIKDDRDFNEGLLAKFRKDVNFRGKNGKDGLNGKDGRIGLDGRDGRDGKDGVDGKDAFTAPIGTILAWHKNYSSRNQSLKLTLPDGWAECNGQPVTVAINGVLDSDGDGIYTLPNLNFANGRFLRGGTNSGVMQKATQVVGPMSLRRGSHQNHMFLGNNNQDETDFVTDADSAGPLYSRHIYGSFLNPVGGNPVANTYRVRSINMSVIWIMRIK